MCANKNMHFSTPLLSKMTSFQGFDIDNTRLDVFFMTYLQDNMQFKSITKVAEFILTFPNGQVSGEIGFSVNKNLLTENLHEESLIAQQAVVDHMHAN